MPPNNFHYSQQVLIQHWSTNHPEARPTWRKREIRFDGQKVEFWALKRCLKTLSLSPEIPSGSSSLGKYPEIVQRKIRQVDRRFSIQEINSIEIPNPKIFDSTTAPLESLHRQTAWLQKCLIFHLKHQEFCVLRTHSIKDRRNLEYVFHNALDRENLLIADTTAVEVKVGEKPGLDLQVPSREPLRDDLDLFRPISSLSKKSGGRDDDDDSKEELFSPASIASPRKTSFVTDYEFLNNHFRRALMDPSYAQAYFDAQVEEEQLLGNEDSLGLDLSKIPIVDEKQQRRRRKTLRANRALRKTIKSNSIKNKRPAAKNWGEIVGMVFMDDTNEDMLNAGNVKLTRVRSNKGTLLLVEPENSQNYPTVTMDMLEEKDKQHVEQVSDALRKSQRRATLRRFDRWKRKPTPNNAEPNSPSITSSPVVENRSRPDEVAAATAAAGREDHSLLSTGELQRRARSKSASSSDRGRLENTIQLQKPASEKSPNTAPKSIPPRTDSIPKAPDQPVVPFISPLVEPKHLCKAAPILDAEKGGSTLHRHAALISNVFGRIGKDANK